MRKYNKKHKSERINALRKQYDAFLEEDQKRKERNQYILGWLDRVRPRSPVRIQVNAVEQSHSRNQNEQDYVVPYKYPIPQRDDKPPCNVDDAAILREVSKKYILIPKKSSIIEQRYGSATPISSANTDTDWKSKYDILNQLKQKEKETTSEYLNQDEQHNRNDNKLNSQRENEYSVKDSLNLNTSLNNVNILEDKTITPLLADNKGKIDDNNSNKPTKPQDSISSNSMNSCDDNYHKIGYKDDEKVNLKSQSPTFANTENDSKKEPEYEYNKNTFETVEVDPCFKPSNETTTITETGYTESLENSSNLSKDQNAKVFDENEKYYPQENLEPIVNTTSHEHSPQIYSEMLPSSTPNEFTEINTENENQNIQQRDDNAIDSSYTNDNSYVHPFVNDKAEIESTQCIENTVGPINADQSQIEEFESEQNELFYQDNSQVNNISNVDNITNNENYANNEEYSYYEATKENTDNYTGEVNEHEESTERYDPNYEQQYNNSYEGNLKNDYTTEEYVQDPNIEFSQQQYYENYDEQNQQPPEDMVYQNNEQQPVLLDNQYNVEEMSSQNETLQYMEQQLNIEDGYNTESIAETNNQDFVTSEEVQGDLKQTDIKST